MRGEEKKVKCTKNFSKGLIIEKKFNFLDVKDLQNNDNSN